MTPEEAIIYCRRCNWAALQNDSGMWAVGTGGQQEGIVEVLGVGLSFESAVENARHAKERR